MGVTRTISDKARRVIIRIDRDQAPYVESKPFHHSQRVERRLEDGGIEISLQVVINNELARLILGFGGHVEVIGPPEFRKMVAMNVCRAARYYQDAGEEPRRNLGDMD